MLTLLLLLRLVAADGSAAAARDAPVLGADVLPRDVVLSAQVRAQRVLPPEALPAHVAHVGPLSCNTTFSLLHKERETMKYGGERERRGSSTDALLQQHI